MRRLCTLPIATLAVLCLAGCASPPDKEIGQARAAIDAARAAGALQYAPDDYRAAVATLDRARRAVVERDYRQALSFALDSRERAQEAQRNAGERKRAARGDAVRAVDLLDAALGEARRRIESESATAKTRLERRHLSDARRAVVVANVALQKAREAIGREDYAAARQAASGVAEHLKAVLDATPAPTSRAPAK